MMIMKIMMKMMKMKIKFFFILCLKAIKRINHRIPINFYAYSQQTYPKSDDLEYAYQKRKNLVPCNKIVEAF